MVLAGFMQQKFPDSSDYDTDLHSNFVGVATGNQAVASIRISEAATKKGTDISTTRAKWSMHIEGSIQHN